MNDRPDEGLPVVEPPTSIPETDLVVGAVLLAAGESSRFEDGNKLLADLGGEPVVRRAARPVAVADLDPRVAVVGNDDDAVWDTLDGLGFHPVPNPDYANGQATSVRTGIRALEAVDAVLIALGDMPAVEPASVRTLVDAYLTGTGSALAAAFEGQRGNPVLFDRRHFASLADVTGDTGGRNVLLESGVLVETGDPGVLCDVDTREDLATLQEG